MSRKRWRVIGAASTAGTLALAMVGMVGGQAQAGESTNSVTVSVAKDGKVTAPATMHPGVAMFTVTGAKGQNVQIAKPRFAGADATDLVRDGNKLNATEDPNPIQRDFEALGGVDVGGVMTAQLSPGTYYLIDTDVAKAKVENVATVVVSGSVVNTPAPTLSGVITAVGEMDWGKYPTAIKHQGTAAFVNDSTDYHFIVMARLLPGKTIADVKKVLADPHGDPTTVVDFTQQVDTGVLSPGRAQTFDYSLKAGRYVLLCFWPDDKTFVPHALMGMVREIDLD